MANRKRASAFGLVVLASAHLAVACQPTVVIGARLCSELPTFDAGEGGDAGAGGAFDAAPLTSLDGGSGEVAAPWSTGFEDGFCGYAAAQGFCYAREGASYTRVSSPTRSGRFAAAFSVNSEAPSGASQARCVRQGTLPKSADYGAWFWVPKTQTNSATWNLFHFRGGAAIDDAALHGLWDVSLVNRADGKLELSVFDFLTGVHPANSRDTVPIPIGAWFHLEFYLKRAADSTGEIIVRQDDVVVLHLTNLITDDSQFGQWYLGNLATTLDPPSSTLYVDDVSISEAP